MVADGVSVVEVIGVEPVIENGYCIGCGACASLPKTEFRMEITPHGTIEARKIRSGAETNLAAARVCPFSDQSQNESVISDRLFPDAHQHERLGRFQGAYAGHVIEDGFRERGSSGGMGTWLLEQLLSRQLVDAIVHVRETVGDVDGLLFGYKISRTVDELRSGAKSRYHPVTLADVVHKVRAEPARYAFSGVPCFIKAIRLLAAEDKQFGDSVTFCMGLVCGHLKSRNYAEFLSWQMGISPENLTRFDFRVKLGGKAANRYGALAVGTQNGRLVERIESMQNLYGQDWGMGLFKPKACDYCDDVVAETADITVGDAWLPRYVADGRGTNLLIVRNKALQVIIDEGIVSGGICLESIKPDEVVESQGSGYTHRREGLSYRLWLADSLGHWRPRKRIEPQSGVYGDGFERRHRLRMQLAEESHEAFFQAKKSNDLKVFFSRIVPIAEEYRDQTRSMPKRILVRLRHFLLGDAVIRRAIRNSRKG